MIEVRDIEARGGTLKGASLRVAPGEWVALVGANGCGKSTLLHAIVGLQSLSGGEIRVDDLDPFDALQVLEVRQRVGFVQQRPDDQIVATSVEDDAAFGPENRGLPHEELRARVDEALAKVGLAGFETREPHTLSGGQKQRLVIAGALALHPGYLLLDEPTAHLDQRGRREVLDVLTTLRTEGRGILYVTHDLREMARADRIAVLFEGRIVFEGTFEQLQTQRAHFEAWGIDRGLQPVTRAPYAGDENERLTLRAHDLYASYRLGTQITPVLKGATLELKAGDFVVIRGDTGTGKSTLLNILAALLEPDSGELTVPDGVTRLIFQDPESQLFAETLLDDVAFGPRNLGATAKEAHDRAHDALTQVGLEPAEFGDRSPFLLSGGEARRAAIAGIIACEPRFLLADEPTSGLDASGRDRVRALLAACTAHAGVVVVTHNPEQFADIATLGFDLHDGILHRMMPEEPEGGSSELRDGVLFSERGEEVVTPTTPQRAIIAQAAREDGRSTSSSPPSNSKKRKSGTTIPTFTLYTPGNSPVHRADPRTKLIAAAALMIALFTTLSWIPIAATLAIILALVALARIPLSTTLRMLKPLSLILVFTLLFNSFTFTPTIAFSAIGLARGVLFVTRLLCVMLLSTLVTLTTSPVALTDGLTLLMAPLRYLRVPVDDLAMMLSIALRFIPTIAEEAATIIRAQTARGASFTSGKLLRRLRAWIPVIIPLLVQLFRRADTLALAMEVRCYVTGTTTDAPRRTRLRVLKLRPSDIIIMAAALALALAILLVR